MTVNQGPALDERDVSDSQEEHNTGSCTVLLSLSPAQGALVPGMLQAGLGCSGAMSEPTTPASWLGANVVLPCLNYNY
jgi:hypothetical protein